MELGPEWAGIGGLALIHLSTLLFALEPITTVSYDRLPFVIFHNLAEDRQVG